MKDLDVNERQINERSENAAIITQSVKNQKYLCSFFIADSESVFCYKKLPPSGDSFSYYLISA